MSEELSDYVFKARLLKLLEEAVQILADLVVQLEEQN